MSVLTVELQDVACRLQDGPFGSNLKSEHYTDEGVRVLRLQNVGVGVFKDDDQAFISEDHFSALKKHECRPGDVLVATLGDPIIRAVTLPESVPVALNKADCIQVRCDPSKIVPQYLVHFLNSHRAQSQAVALSHGQTRPRVNLGQLRRFPIPLPPLEEQRRIAASLDAAAEIRAKRREALEKLDSLTQAIFIDMFGDPAANPYQWPRRSLREVAVKFSDGPFGSNLKSDHYRDSGVRVLRLQNIGSGRFVDDVAAYISEEHFASLAKHECRPGDVLVATLGDPNLRACIQPSWLTVAINKADCVQLRVDEGKATSEWLCSLLNHPSTEEMAQSLVRGQTRTRISMGRLRDLEVPVPPVELQEQFSRRQRGAAAQLRLLETSHHQLENLFSSLQQRAFRGEL